MRPDNPKTKWSRRLSLNPSVARARTMARGRGERTDEGISLIEVVVAFTILMITLIPLGYLLNSAVAASANTRQRQAALQLADSWVDILSNVTPNSQPLTNQPVDPTTLFSRITTQLPSSSLANVNYSVSVKYTLQTVKNQGQTSLCAGTTPGTSNPPLYVVQVDVSWDHGNESVSESTAPPTTNAALGYVPDGFLSIQMNNSTEDDVSGNSPDTRVQALPVTITQTQFPVGVPALSPNPATVYPDDTGCAFVQVPEGGYTVSVNQPSSGTPNTFTGWSGTPDFVNTTGLTTESVTNQSVPIQGVDQVQFDASNDFDEGINSSVSYGASSAVDDGVQCPGAGVVTCVTTGNGTSTASGAWGATGAAWSSTTFGAATNIAQVACTTGSSPNCVGVGYKSNGAALAPVILTASASSGLGTVQTDTVPANTPAITDITQVTCPSTNGCYAIGTTSSGPVLLAGSVGVVAKTDVWHVITPPATATSLTSIYSISCPFTSTVASTLPTCVVSAYGTVASKTGPLIYRLDGDPANLATTSTWTPSFTTDQLSSTVQSVGAITCSTLSATSARCLTVGTTSAAPTVPTLVATTVGTSTDSAWSSDSFPPAGSITGVSCVTTTCVAIGTTTGGAAAVWTGVLNPSTPDTWTSQSANSTITSLSAVSVVACGNPAGSDVADCVITATKASASPSGILLKGSLSGGTWSWNPVTLPVTNVNYFYDVSCESSPSATRATCSAVGSAPTGPVVIATPSGPAGAWTTTTPSSLPGAIVNGIPLDTSPDNLNWTSYSPGANNPNATTLSNLYPQSSGYSVAASDCTTGVANTTTLNALPGGTTSATVPVGFLPLDIVTAATKVPVSGATVKLTSTTANCGADTYTMPVTDAYGLTQTSVPFGTYSYTVTTAGGQISQPTSPTVRVTVGTNSVVVTTTTTGSNPTSTPVTYYLPTTPAVASS